MDSSLANYKPRRLQTSGTPSVIALNRSGDHLAVGCDNGDICIWKLPLGDDPMATHKVCIGDWGGVEVSSSSLVFGYPRNVWTQERAGSSRQAGLCERIRYYCLHFPPTILQSQESLSAMNLEADDLTETIRDISYHDRLNCVATATVNRISIWELDRHRCMSLR
jgi:hypothetical protein